MDKLNWQRHFIERNSIDRLDNTKGYIIDNCVPCCSDCNEMKLDRKESDFINLVNLIHNNRSKNENHT